MARKYCFGVLGARAGLAGADLVFKLRRLARARDGADALDLLCADDAAPATLEYVLESLCRLGAERVVLPGLGACARLRPPMQAVLVDPVAALREHLERFVPGGARVGVLGTDPALRACLVARLDQGRWPLCFPNDSTDALPADDGAVLTRAGVERLARACADLRAQGADVIVPGEACFAPAVDALGERGHPVVDLNLVHARYALELDAEPRTQARKIGVVGGVGPAATVDFTDKIVRNTPAGRDQDHVKLVVEMNPQIPDRTAHLVGDGVDPTGEIYATCRQLELDAADFIAIPCNTAHAFVARVQPCLSIPVVNMLAETVAYIRARHPTCRRVGLLGTNGTVASRVYHDIVEAAGLEILVPDVEQQALVMRAIYGEQGVKAGFTTGPCREDLMQALEHLVQRGAEVAILGCTELPLILAMDEHFALGGQYVVLLDPTTILARRCVALARG